MSELEPVAKVNPLFRSHQAEHLGWSGHSSFGIFPCVDLFGKLARFEDAKLGS